MIKRVIIIVLLFLVQANIFGATITSDVASGNWSAASTWSAISRTGTITLSTSSKTITGVGTLFTTELAVGSVVYANDGITLIGIVASITSNTSLQLVANAAVAISSQSYKAKIVPTTSDDVVIPTGKTVLLDITTVSAKSISISGTLSLTTADITINSTLITVTSPSGTIYFNSSIIRLPANVVVYLQNGTSSITGSCNNNDEIFVGSVEYGVCTGGGALYLFREIEAAGGINVVWAGAIGTSQAICSGAIPSTLTSTTPGTGTGSGTISYEWQTNATGSYVTIAGATSATYSPPALATTSSYQRRTLSVNGMYTFYSEYTTPVIITVSSANTWTGATNTSWFTPTNWSCGIVPGASSDVTIPNVSKKPIIDGSNTKANANTLTVSSGASITIYSGNSIKVTDKITNNGGTITVEDSASLIQTNTVANSGNINYKRNYTGGETDYTYWSSPVAGQNLLAVSPSTKLDKFFSFNASIENWLQEVPSNTTMAIGKGYIIRGVPPPASPAIPKGFGTNTFIGVPNNGNISIAVSSSTKSNLIGNPYPSAINADQFIFDNQSVIEGTIYFWTHNTPIAIGTPNPGTGAWAYSGNDYAAYSLTGGVGTGSGTVAISGGGKPTGKIAAGQSFFTTSTASGGNVIFTNSMRVDGSGNAINNSNFYKTKSPKNKAACAIEKNRMWLNLTNNQGAFKQTLLGYITGATNTWDTLYDAKSFDGNDFLDFYTINEDTNLTIQGRGLPFNENDQIPLGYRIAVEGTFAINIDQTDGLLSNQSVFIEDKLTNTLFDLTNGNYMFTTAAGTFNDRFVLHFTDRTLRVNDNVAENNGIIALYSNNNQSLIIRNNAKDVTVNNVALFNVVGQKIANWDVNDKEQSNMIIPIKNVSSAIYIVKIKTTEGEFSKKIIIK